MERKIKLPRILLFSMVIGILLTISIGLSIWLITDSIQIKPELDVDKVIINYLDDKEAYYNSNILLPSNKALGLSIENEELTYSYKLKSSDEDFIEVDVNNKKGPIDVGIYIIEVVYTTPTYDSEGKVNGSKSVTKELDFEIKPRDISTAEVSFNRTAGNKFDLGMSLDKFTEKVNVELSINEEEIKEELTLEINTDYTCGFPVIDQTGTFTATITGTGNFTGTTTVEYIIQNILVINVSKEFNNYDSSSNYYYFSYRKYDETTFPLKNWISVKTGSGEEVTSNLTFEYKVSNASDFNPLGFESVLPAKDYTIKIIAEAEGFSSAETEINLAIEQASLHDAIITLEKDEFVFNNTEYTPIVTSVTLNGITLVGGIDYILSYENNKDANVKVVSGSKNPTSKTAKVNVVGMGNYTDTKEKTFNILQAETEITNPTYANTVFIEGIKLVEQSAGYATVLGKQTKLTGKLETYYPDNVEFGTKKSLPITLNYEFIPTDVNSNGISNYRRATSVSSTELTMYAVAYIGDTYYSTLEKALSTATEAGGANVYVVPGLYNEYGLILNIEKTLNITQNVNLYIPYSGDSIKVDKNDIKSLNYSTFSDSNGSNVSKNRVTYIKLINGADINISNGASLYLGGESRNIGITGKYAEIGLQEGSKISCNGNFYCFGYVKEINAKHGNQTDYKDKYNNDYDADRLIHITEGGLFYSIACFYDITDVMTMKNLNDNDIFPLNAFDFSAVQTYLQIDAGAEFKATTFIYQLKSGEDIVINEDLNIISDTSSAMFKLTSGNLSIEYCPTNENFTNNSNITRFYLNGELSIGYISFSMEIKGIPAEISTKDVFLPISYKFNLFINDSGDFTADYKMKFLPGSLLQINGGTFSLNSEVIFYTKEHSSYVDRYPTTYDDSRLINNGNLIIETSGKLGAFVETQVEDNSATIDLSSVSDSTQLTVTTIDGESKNTISITSNGYFADSSENGKSIYQFVSGSVVNSANNGGQCWDGDKFALMDLDVVIATTGYTYNIYAYEVYISSNQSGSDKTLVSFDSTGCAEVPLGKFINIIVTRSKSATLNGTEINSSTWYEVTSNMEIIITPNKGRKVHVYTKPDSGNSDTTFKVYEKNPNGTEIELYNQTGTMDDKGVDFYIVEGWQVKATCSMGVAGSFGADTQPDKDNIKITYFDDDGNIISEEKYTEKYVTVNNDCSIYFPRKANSSCLAEGILITMADGSKIKVEDVKPGDMLIVFNHETGQYEVAEVLFNDSEEISTYTVINLEFSNNSIVKVISEHGFFDLDLMKYVYIDEYNYKDYIGHRFVSAVMIDGEMVQSIVTLDKAYLTKEYIRVYSPVTKYHMNYITEDILSMPGGISGLFNIFEYDDNLQYNQELMEKDIKEYGLFTYEDFKDLVSYELYSSFATQYFKVAIAKGYLTWEQLYYYIERYGPLV